jgi:hypothetical protein
MPKTLPSALIDRPVPEFRLAGLREGEPGLSPADPSAPGGQAREHPGELVRTMPAPSIRS